MASEGPEDVHHFQRTPLRCRLGSINVLTADELAQRLMSCFGCPGTCHHHACQVSTWTTDLELAIVWMKDHDQIDHGCFVLRSHLLRLIVVTKVHNSAPDFSRPSPTRRRT